MKYLSFDLESTGLEENDFIIEFGMIPFCTEKKILEESLAFHCFVQCPPFEELKPSLNPWVVKHNQKLIEKAHLQGLALEQFKKELEAYLTSKKVQNYFRQEKITLFGKSLSAIDLPFLNRDLGWSWVRQYFQHRQLDLSSIAYHLVDQKILPQECQQGSSLSQHLGFGEVAHTALEDARNTALMYLKILNLSPLNKTH